jgi:hypothetical protein
METMIKILCTDRNAPLGKLADAEVHFIGGDLDGLKLLGFGIWRGRDGTREHVSLPSRPFIVNGDRRSFELLRGIDDPSAQDRLRDLVLQAYLDAPPRPDSSARVDAGTSADRRPDAATTSNGV